MSREKDRQKQRLINLANFIEKNPHLYSHQLPSSCIVGLGNRLIRGKLAEPSLFTTWDSLPLRTFAKRYGVPFFIADNLFWGRFGKINPRQKNWNFAEYDTRIPVKSAVTVLRYLTK